MSHAAPCAASPFAPPGRIAGTWRLHPGQAIGLRPKETSVLRIHRGPVWVTLGEPGAPSPQASGDLFLLEGESLVVPAGARLVMEPLSSRAADGPVCFDWLAAESLAAGTGRFGREVLIPLSEAASALVQAISALLRGVRGLLGYGEFLVAGRGRVLSPLESMHS